MQPNEDQGEHTFGFDAFDLANRIVDENSSDQFRPDDFGPYRFIGEKPLGVGSLGDVWLAEEQGAERQVAVKFLRALPQPDLAAGEIKNQGKLEHRYVARLYNYGQLEDGTPWLAMEYVNGLPLDKYCQQRKCTVEQRIVLFRAICEAVQYAHGEMVFHGDLKPPNILVKEGGEPKLLDFGLAQRLHKSDTTDQAEPAVVGFTPAYAAPEQFRGKSSGFRSDVYSLGVILYELLAGELPFDASRHTFAEIELSKTSAEQPEPPSVVAVRAARGSSENNRAKEASAAEWRDLDAICLKAMHSDVNLRYSSVEALIQDLDRYIRYEPLTARLPYTRAYRLGKFVRRNSRAIVAVSAVFLLIAGVVTFYTVRLANERNKALAEAARTRRIQRFMLNLFQNGDQQAAPSKDLTVMAALDRGAASASSLNADPETQAELYRTLGMLYEQLNNFPKAEELLQKGVERARTLGPSNPQMAPSLVQLGLLRGDQTQFKEAESLIRQALDVTARQHVPPDDSEVLDAKSALGKVLVESGSYDKAVASLQPIVDRSPEGEEGEVILSESLTALADAQQYSGRYETAEALNRRALELDRKLHGNAHPRVAEDLANIGTTEATLGHYPEAEGLYRQAAGILEGWYGADHPETVQAKSFIALMAMQDGKEEEAEKLLKNVLPMQERAYGTSINPNIALTYDMLGKLAVKKGNLVEAEADFSRSAEITDKLFGESDYKTAICENNLANVLVKEGQYARAEKVVRPAVKALTARPMPGNKSVGMAQLNLGEALLGQKRYAEAEAPLEAAYGIFKDHPGTYAPRLEEARKDLAQVYEKLKQPERAAARR